MSTISSPVATSPARGGAAATATVSRRLVDGSHLPHNISVYGFFLGAVFAAGLSTRSFVGAYIAAVALFHQAEYTLTALYNLRKLELSSYLLDHSPEYKIAHGTALLEYAVEAYFFPSLKDFPYVRVIQWTGVAMVVVCQCIRSLAMVHAKANFSHQIVAHRDAQHQLVTDGVYAYLRHPSYFGFYWWAVGTQLMLVNPVCTIGFLGAFCVSCALTVVGGVCTYEEHSLVRFFGDAYVQYQKRTHTWIPFTA
ncbi:farnesyl cysteine-carboxyl methyltransferase [Sorochytrium milnesiophthora]